MVQLNNRFVFSEVLFKNFQNWSSSTTGTAKTNSIAVNSNPTRTTSNLKGSLISFFIV